MSQQSEQLDFSGLFKLDVLVHLDIVNHSFYEVGLKKFIALSSDKELLFLYINPNWERFDNVFDWDFVDNPVYCMCFEPSGTWVLIVSDQKVLLVPFLPLFIPQNTFDYKWSLSSVTVLPLGDIIQPTSVVWWLTKESENIIIIGSKTGTTTFYSLESQKIIGETKVNGPINDLQMCFDDSLDLLALLISKGPSQQWKLVLEHRSFGYNWLTQIRAQNDKDKKESFMSYIRQLSKDKITLLIQGGSKDENRPQTVEYVLKPMEYLPIFRKGSNNWALTSQYVNGRHFLTAFELNEGTLILESPAEDSASRTLRPQIKKDAQYMQGLWSQRLLYLVRKNELEVHSSNFSVVQGDALLGTKRDFSELWAAEMIGDVHKAYLMSAKEPSSSGCGWREPTFMCDLQLPRFILEPCLVITSCGAYILNTVCEPCEWLVGLIMRGGVGAELSAAALGAPVPVLLKAAADMLMSRGKIAPAQYLYSLSQSQPDGWIARLGVFGRIHELSMFKQTGSFGSFGNAAVTSKLLALLLKIRTNSEEKFDVDVKFTNLGTAELLELTTVAAAIGLWELVPVFSVHRGYPHLFLSALKARNSMCRGAIICLLNQTCVLPILLEENGQWLFDFIAENCNQFDTVILKRLCLWLNPLQDQLRPVIRDLKQGITSIYATRMLQLIATFVHVTCATEARIPCPELRTEVAEQAETWKYHFLPRRALSCGLGHWALAEEGNAKIMIASTVVNTELIGSVIDVACGRHHTLLLTENGIYSAGDNTFGQLGVGCMWAGGMGDAASASGALMHVRKEWTSPLTAIAAGHYHSAAIDLGGRLYTWGWGVHGQLCLGNIHDYCTPQLVAKFQGRKVLSVSCGACHTVVLTMSGEVWACGAGVFGQLGGGGREKSSLCVRVALPDPVETVAAGYFHNLALTTKGQLWCWGASPQQVRATHARRTSTPTGNSAQLASSVLVNHLPDPHLVPQLVDLHNVRGKIVQLSAGWHHSCIIDSTGSVYTWGLNFDGQLGSGDRKQVQIPTEVKVRSEGQDIKESKPDVCDDAEEMRCIVACGGDFTVYIHQDGRIYATGNMHQQPNNEIEKSNNRVIMMKTTKRVIKIPASRSNNKFLFQQIDRIDIMFPFDIDGQERKPIGPINNPLSKMSDFKNNSWADDVILHLKPWITDDIILRNPNVAAKVAYHNKNFSDCLKNLLENLKREIINDRTYLTHPSDDLNKQDESKIVITNAISKRIKDISMGILNEESYSAVDPAMYQTLPCCCDEIKYSSTRIVPALPDNVARLSSRAAQIIDKCMGLFPVDSNLWETCFKLSKDFYLENNLPVEELEAVVGKFMESNATTMASAIMYSKDCAQYAEILTPKFYLNMCSEILDTWG